MHAGGLSQEQAEARAFLAARGIYSPADKSAVRAAEAEAEARVSEAGARDQGAAVGPAGASEIAISEVGASEVGISDVGASEIGISKVVDYRSFKGSDQWRVRWAGYGEEGDTWEAMRVLDTESLRRQAQALKLRE